MKHIYLLLISIILFSCGNERILQLPEIENAKITEIRDVSHAYLFYDETKEDSVELNRKNLIITTNWLVNVDKRLTLAQAIPKIKFLQDKKRSAELHKNEDAKNYFTCNDTSIKNLGFLEFTDVEYWEESSLSLMVRTSQLDFHRISLHPEIHLDRKIHITRLTINDEFETDIIEYKDFSEFLNSIRRSKSEDLIILELNFDKNLSFQDYISFKSFIKDLNVEGIGIDNREFIY